MVKKGGGEVFETGGQLLAHRITIKWHCIAIKRREKPHTKINNEPIRMIEIDHMMFQWSYYGISNVGCKFGAVARIRC